MSNNDILIRLSPQQLRGFDASSEQLALVQATGDAIVLRRVAGQGRSHDQIRAIGTTATIPAADLFHVLNLNHLTGTVVLADDAASKTVFLRNGEIIFAQSTLADDRLGESLIRAGLLTQQQLDDAARSISADRKLGQILVEQGWITPQQLFQGVRRQVREIVWSLIDWNARFVVYEGFRDPSAVLALNLSTWHLLIDGIRRSAAWAHIPPEVPDKEIIVQIAEDPGNMALTQEERRVLALAAPGITLAELTAQAGLGRLETVKVVHHLLRRGIVITGVSGQKPAGQRDPATELAQIVAAFGDVLRLVDRLVRASHPDVDVFGRVNQFIDDMPKEMAAVFGAQRFGPDGSLDAGLIAEHLAAASAGRVQLVSAFNEVLYFMLFEIKHLLSESETDQVLAAIDKMKLF